MNRKGLCFLIALALGGGMVAAQAHGAIDSGALAGQDTQSQDSSTMADQNIWPEGYDNRWYVTLTAGAYMNDTDRNTDSFQDYYGLGFGRYISKDVSIDVFFDHTTRDNFLNVGNWGTNTYGVAARFYSGDWNAWRPFIVAAAGGSRAINGIQHDWSPTAQLGVGLSKTVNDMVDFRLQAAYRYNWDDQTQPAEGGYGDWLIGLTLVERFGAPPTPPPPKPVAPPPPPAPTCDQLDDDSDGVNNCVDQCPSTAAGILVGPDGCAQKVVIDLRGVNFKFDRPSKGETDIAPTLREPTSDSMMILKQAVDTLQRYPQVKVTVAGYTDSVGSDAYNQGLSERRASIVYNYLTAHGINADRLEGPVGHGENDPVASNDTDNGRARNRRVELQTDQD